MAHERKAYEKRSFQAADSRAGAELKALASLPDEAIDTSDAPELSDWSGAKRGLFYRPVKQQS
jgi:hypothetical protein